MSKGQNQSSNDTFYYLTGEINANSISSAIDFILDHNAARTKTPIVILINSYGGELCQMTSMVDIMKASSVPVHTVGTGVVASAATFIFLAGVKGHRILTENTIFMTHQMSGMSEGKYHELLADLRHSNIRHEQMIKLYSDLTGLSKSFIKSKLVGKGDLYLTAQEALKMGLCDKIDKINLSKKKIIREK